MAALSKSRSVGNKPNEYISTLDHGVKPDAVYTLNGYGIPSSWAGTDNRDAIQAAIDTADSKGIRHVIHPVNGYCLIGSEIDIPGYMSFEGINPYSSVLVPANSFPSGAAIIKCNNTSGDVDGLFVKRIGFQMNGLQVANCTALLLNRVNTITTVEEVTFTQMGSSSIGIDIFRGSSLFLDKLRFNGGTNADGSTLVGTNMRVRQCPGVFCGHINLEHANRGIIYENKTDAVGGPIYMPTFRIDSLYCESHASDVITVEEDNGHLYTQPMISIGNIEGRASTSSGALLRVLPYSGLNHNVAINIDSLQFTGPFAHAVQTPARNYDTHLANFFYKSGNQSALVVDGILDALTNNPRIQVIKTSNQGTSSGVELWTNAGGGAGTKLGEITVDNSTGLMIMDGFNGIRFPDSRIELTGLPTYADNAAAAAGGLLAGRWYKTATGELRVRV